MIKNFIAKVFLCFFVILSVYFLYFGFTTTPELLNESDSLTYHIPIAKEIAKGSFIPPEVHQGLGFYPGASEIILALLMRMQLPLNIFGVLAFVVLFFICRKVGEDFGLDKVNAIIFAGSVVTLQSILRWPLNQTIDVWLTVFFLGFLSLLKNPKVNSKYYLLLGLVGGFLIGSKYSGLLFFLILTIGFGRDVFAKIKLKNLIFFLTPLFIFGFSWYIRNYLLTGNPIYPANFFFLNGDPEYARVNSSSWSVLGNVLQTPPFVIKFIEALLAEFLLWIFVLILPLYVFLVKNFSKDIYKLSVVGGLVFLFFITLLPATPIVSNMRYIYPGIAVLMLSAFLVFPKKESEIGVLSLLSASFGFTNLEYHPKIIILGFLLSFYLVIKKNIFKV